MECDNLGELPFFKGFETSQLNLIQRFCEISTYSNEETIFQQGDHATNLYILIEGEVAIYFKPYDGPPMMIKKIEPGEGFGWSAVLQRLRYNAAAVTTAETRVIQINSKNLKKIYSLDPDTGWHLLNQMAGFMKDRSQIHQEKLFQLFSDEIKIKTNPRKRKNKDGTKKQFHA